MHLGLPVRANEIFGSLQRGPHAYPARKARETGAVALDGDFEPLARELLAEREEARQVVAPAKVPGVERGSRTKRTRLPEVESRPVPDDPRIRAVVAEVPGGLHDMVPFRKARPPRRREAPAESEREIDDAADQLGIEVLQPVDAARALLPDLTDEPDRRRRRARHDDDVPRRDGPRDLRRKRAPHGFVLERRPEEVAPPALAVRDAFDGRSGRRSLARAVRARAADEPYRDAGARERVRDLLGVDSRGRVVRPQVLRQDVDDDATRPR